MRITAAAFDLSVSARLAAGLLLALLSMAYLCAPIWAKEENLQTQLPVTGVTFSTDDPDLQRIFDTAEQQSRRNYRQFAQYKVLVEGGYQDVYLETQPMGGVMWGKRDLTIAKNNIMIFVDFQRADGGIPKNIGMGPGGIILYRGPEARLNLRTVDGFGLSGYCFPEPAFDLYFWLGKDRSYLERIYNAIAQADAWLWANFNKNKDGCLDFQYINEDGSIRFYSYWGPYESMDSMALSYGGRSTLAQIAHELGNEPAAVEWKRKADEVRDAVRQRLWRPDRHACYDRDRNGKFVDVLVHNNLRCMYHGLFDQTMADEFIRYHLLNSDEFWTAMPLPTVACNDPIFKNWPNNSWSGQPEALTYQRAIRALENYGHWAIETMIGRRLLDNLTAYNTWPQQWDPFSGRPNASWNEYGPALLSSLEYLSHMHGVDIVHDHVWYSGLSRGQHKIEYTQRLGSVTYTAVIRPDGFRGLVNGRESFVTSPGVRVITDRSGSLVGLCGIDTIERDITVRWGTQSQTLKILPNENYVIDRSGRFVRGPSSSFYFPDRPTIARQHDYALPSVPSAITITSDFPDAVIHYTIDGSEPTDASPTYGHPLSVDKACVIKARAFRTGGYLSATATAQLLPPCKSLALASVASGLKFDYYELPFKEGFFADLAAQKPLRSEIVAGFEDAAPQRTVDYAMRFTGVLKVPHDSLYKFSVEPQIWYNNSNRRLYIDGHLLYSSTIPDQWHPTIALLAGPHEIRLERSQQKNMEHPPGKTFRVQWQDMAEPNSKLADIPDELYGNAR